MKKYVADKNRVLKQILDDNILIPVGEQVFENNSIITLNETSLFIWQLLCSPVSLDELVEKITEEYDVEEKVARNDILHLLNEFATKKAISIIEY